MLSITSNQINASHKKLEKFDSISFYFADIKLQLYPPVTTVQV